jgi:phage terminase Nu1 subunit (DNA packaging protein)
LEDKGIVVRSASAVQLLAMKLAASRDERDEADAEILLKWVRDTSHIADEESVWQQLERYLSPSLRGKAKQALGLLWSKNDGATYRRED